MNLCLPISFYILICTQVCACLKIFTFLLKAFCSPYICLPIILYKFLYYVMLVLDLCGVFYSLTLIPSHLCLRYCWHRLLTYNIQWQLWTHRLFVCCLNSLLFAQLPPWFLLNTCYVYNTMNVIKYTYLFQEKNLLSFISSKQAVSCLFSCQGPVTIFFIAASKYLKFSYQKNSVHNERFID